MKWSAVLALPSLLFFSHLVCSQPDPLPSDCVWNRDTEFSTFPPVLMDKSTWLSILPTMNNAVREIRIRNGTKVVIACPEAVILATGTIVTEGVCKGGGVLNVGGSAYTMKELGCNSRPKAVIQKNLGKCGHSNASDLHAIGFAIPGCNFYKLIQVCFEPVLETALYTYHTLRGESVPASHGSPSIPSFKTGTGFYTVSPNNCYEITAQETLMANILGVSSVIDSANRLYFARGHLSPDVDFLTELEADATYYYINVNPQWQIINNGNWKFLEIAVRDLAGRHGTDMQVWNGPWNILKLDDVTSNPVEIYLGLFEGQSVLPAPDVMWKVIYEQSTNRAVAVVTSNNPYLTSFPTMLCTDLCAQISWITFDVTDLPRGATYCCTVADLRSAVPNVPDLGSVGLLTD